MLILISWLLACTINTHPGSKLKFSWSSVWDVNHFTTMVNSMTAKKTVGKFYQQMFNFYADLYHFSCETGYVLQACVSLPCSPMQMWASSTIVLKIKYCCLSNDVASRSEITPCNKIDKPLVVYRFSGHVMTSITTLRTCIRTKL